MSEETREVRTSFVYYLDWMEELLKYPPGMRLRIDDAIKRYALYGEEPEDPEIIYSIFGLARRKIDRDQEKYDKIREKRRAAGRKGALKTNQARWGEGLQESANDGTGQHSSAMSANAEENQQESANSANDGISQHSSAMSANAEKTQQESANSANDGISQHSSAMSANAEKKSASVGKCRQKSAKSAVYDNENVNGNVNENVNGNGNGNVNGNDNVNGEEFPLNSLKKNSSSSSTTTRNALAREEVVEVGEKDLNFLKKIEIQKKKSKWKEGAAKKFKISPEEVDEFLDEFAADMEIRETKVRNVPGAFTEWMERRQRRGERGEKVEGRRPSLLTTGGGGPISRSRENGHASGGELDPIRARLLEFEKQTKERNEAWEKIQRERVTPAERIRAAGYDPEQVTMKQLYDPEWRRKNPPTLPVTSPIRET